MVSHVGAKGRRRGAACEPSRLSLRLACSCACCLLLRSSAAAPPAAAAARRAYSSLSISCHADSSPPDCAAAFALLGGVEAQEG